MSELPCPGNGFLPSIISATSVSGKVPPCAATSQIRRNRNGSRLSATATMAAIPRTSSTRGSDAAPDLGEEHEAVAQQSRWLARDPSCARRQAAPASDRPLALIGDRSGQDVCDDDERPDAERELVHAPRAHAGAAPIRSR